MMSISISEMVILLGLF